MMKALMACSLTLLLLIVASLTSHTTYARDVFAECYLMNWDVETRAAPHPPDVRRWADARRDVTSPADLARLRAILAPETLLPTPPPTRDLRFVVDIRHSDGTTESYYADRFSLMSADMRRSRRVDRTNFRHEIDRFVGYAGRLHR